MLTSVDAEIVLDGGCLRVLRAGDDVLLGDSSSPPPTKCPPTASTRRAPTRTKPACGPKRGHGSVQPRFAIEVQLDRIAERLEIDPIELRRRNFIGANTRTVNDLRVTSNGFPRVPGRGGARQRLEAQAPAGFRTGAASGWRARRTSPGPTTRSTPNDMPQSGGAAAGGPVGAGGGLLGGVPRSGRGWTRWSRTWWPRSSGCRWSISGCWRGTRTSRRSTWARTRPG